MIQKAISSVCENMGFCRKGTRIIRGFINSLLTHYQTINSRLFQTKKFAGDNFRFEENGRKLSKQVENTVGKGEIAHYEQFLLFPQCFQKACLPGASKGIIVWEWVNIQHCKLGFLISSAELDLPTR